MTAKSFWQLQANAIHKTLQERFKLASLAQSAARANNLIHRLQLARYSLRRVLLSYRETTTLLRTNLRAFYRHQRATRLGLQATAATRTPDIQLSIYIAATAEQVWQALTDPHIIEQYWSGARVQSDWQVGSAVYYSRHGRVTHEHVVLRAEPCACLQYSFHSVSAEGLPRELPSRVSFAIATMDRMVRLTVVHDRLPGQSDFCHAYQEFWPMLLSNLKTLLETGQPLFTQQTAAFSQ